AETVAEAGVVVGAPRGRDGVDDSLLALDRVLQQERAAGSRSAAYFPLPPQRLRVGAQVLLDLAEHGADIDEGNAAVAALEVELLRLHRFAHRRLIAQRLAVNRRLLQLRQRPPHRFHALAQGAQVEGGPLGIRLRLHAALFECGLVFLHLAQLRRQDVARLDLPQAFMVEPATFRAGAFELAQVREQACLEGRELLFELAQGGQLGRRRYDFGGRGWRRVCRRQTVIGLRADPGDEDETQDD